MASQPSALISRDSADLLDRRGLLKIGMLGSLGLTLGDVLRLQAQSAGAGNAAAKRATSVIVLHMRGGPSQLETFDMKPAAPADIRGEFRPVRTNVPGNHICELLPRTAQVMDQLTGAAERRGRAHRAQ